MKKTLLFLFICLGTFVLFGRCNNNPEPDYTGAARKDTVVVKDSVIVKDTVIKH